jgi:hypothetical protein
MDVHMLDSPYPAISLAKQQPENCPSTATYIQAAISDNSKLLLTASAPEQQPPRRSAMPITSILN